MAVTLFLSLLRLSCSMYTNVVTMSSRIGIPAGAMLRDARRGVEKIPIDDLRKTAMGLWDPSFKMSCVNAWVRTKDFVKDFGTHAQAPVIYLPLVKPSIRGFERLWTEVWRVLGLISRHWIIAGTHTLNIPVRLGMIACPFSRSSASSIVCHLTEATLALVDSLNLVSVAVRPPKNLNGVFTA